MRRVMRNFIYTLVLMFLVSMVLGCTNVLIRESASASREKVLLSSTVGVAAVTHCKGPAQIDYVEHEDGRKETKIMCDGELVRSESNGFTGWDTIDAVLTGFISWITFGAVL